MRGITPGEQGMGLAQHDRLSDAVAVVRTQGQLVAAVHPFGAGPVRSKLGRSRPPLLATARGLSTDFARAHEDGNSQSKAPVMNR